MTITEEKTMRGTFHTESVKQLASYCKIESPKIKSRKKKKKEKKRNWCVAFSDQPYPSQKLKWRN